MATDHFPIEAGHIMLFARSIGDTNPIYHDASAAAETEPGQVIPPPTFVQASAQFTEGYNLRPVQGQPWFGSGKEPTGVTRAPGGGGGGTGFHAEQHYEYHAPIAPGDVLRAVDKPGNVVGARRPARRHAQVQREHHRVLQPGRRARRDRAVGRRADVAGRGIEEANMALSKNKLSVGDTHEEVVVDNLSRTQIIQYAGASGDYNPLHTDEIFTTKVAGYPTVFAHGMLSMGVTGKMLTNLVGDGRLTKYGVRFVNQVWPGDSLTAKATVEAIREEDGVSLVDLSVSTVNQDGAEVVKGSATARIDD